MSKLEGAQAGSLRPELVARLGSLHLRARQVVEGVLSGLHRSPHRGQSIEFAEHKEYAPGDEVRHIDWKALAKFDKVYVKQFEQETNLRAYLLLDSSASMGYGEGGVTKLEYAKVLAASLAYLLSRQADAVGLVAFAERTHHYLPARSGGGHLHELINQIDRLDPEGTSNLDGAIDFLSEQAPKRSLVLVLSDLLDPDLERLMSLRRLRARKHDVVVLHLLDRAERDFNFEDPTLFVGMEDDRRVQVSPAQIRESYLEEVERYLADAQRILREGGIHYRQIITDQDYDRVLIEFLGRRLSGKAKGR